MGEPIDSQYIPASGLTHGDASAFAFYDGFIPDFEFMFSTVYQAHFQQNNTGSDSANCVSFIHDAIMQVSAQTGIRDVYLLSVISEESDGNCRVPGTTDRDGNFTGGLMQCEGSFDGSSIPDGAMTFDAVQSMISTGAAHLQGNLSDSRASGNIYTALRLYNSGGFAPGSSDLSDPYFSANQSNSAYVTDLANRMHGCLDRR